LDGTVVLRGGLSPVVILFGKRILRLSTGAYRQNLGRSKGVRPTKPFVPSREEEHQEYARPARIVNRFTPAKGRLGYAACANGEFPTMAALAKIILSRVSRTDVDIETLKTIIMFCGVGLTVSLMCASYGLDLSPGFF
jgi:hypothetical protein